MKGVGVAFWRLVFALAVLRALAVACEWFAAAWLKTADPPVAATTATNRMSKNRRL